MSELTTIAAIWQRHITCRMVWPGIDLPPNEASGREYVLAEQGLFVRAQRPGLTAIVPVAPCALGRLGRVTPFVQLTLPRVPVRLVTRLLQEAREARGADGQLVEMLCYLAYDEGWVYYVPPQEQHVAALHTSLADAPAFTREMARMALIEIHTHARLAPFFSATDQADEQGSFRIFIVLGEVDCVPRFLARVGVFGHFWPIPVDQVLDLPSELLVGAHCTAEEA